MVKKLLARVREFKTAALLAPLFILFEVVLEIIIPKVVANLIDRGVALGDMAAIERYGALLVGCALLAMLCGVLSGIYASKASTGLARNLRHDMYHAVQDFSFANIDHFSTASIITRLTTDVTNIQNAFQMTIRVAVRAPAMLVFALLMALRINRSLGMIFLIAVPVMAFTMGGLMSMVGPLFRKVFRTYDEMNTVVQENVRGIRVVKSFVRESFENEKFRAVSAKLYDGFCRAGRMMAGAMPLMQVSMYACMLLLSWLGAGQVVGGAITTGDLTSLFAYAMQILTSLMMVSMVMISVSMSRESGKRIVELLDEQPDLHDPASPVTTVRDGSIVFENVGFGYKGDDGQLALHDIDLTVASGQTIGILGGTGAAKSTLVQLIPRLYDVSHGRVLVGGVDVRDYSLSTLRHEVAMVLQKNVLFSGTVRDNLRWGDETATDEMLWQACRMAQAEEFVRKMPNGLDTHLDQGGTNVSGGQRQRLCIARALLKKPKILILDDSTSAVDTKTDALIRQAMRESLPDTTKLIIAQRISSVMHADCILLMKNGSIVARGTHDELMKTSETYREIYEHQQKGDEDNG